MFERFTDRARKVMALANQEAHRLQHDHIDTEHILLGLVKEGTGVGATALRNLDVESRKLTFEIGKRLRGGDQPVSGMLPQTSGAKKVIEYAIEQAHEWDHRCVGTEHMLLGLIRESDGMAAQVLASFDVDLRSAKEECLAMLAGLSESCGDASVSLDSQDVGRSELGELVKGYLERDPRLQEMKLAKESAVREADYERAAQLRDECLRISEDHEGKIKAVEQIVARNGSVADLMIHVLKDLPDEPITAGRFLLELIAEHPELGRRLRPVMDRIREACEGL